jgi:hypothetical protein
MSRQGDRFWRSEHFVIEGPSGTTHFVPTTYSGNPGLATACGVEIWNREWRQRRVDQLTDPPVSLCRRCYPLDPPNTARPRNVQDASVSHV